MKSWIIIGLSLVIGCKSPTPPLPQDGPHPHYTKPATRPLPHELPTDILVAVLKESDELGWGMPLYIIEVGDQDFWRFIFVTPDAEKALVGERCILGYPGGHAVVEPRA